jgi:hypothetical protein
LSIDQQNISASSSTPEVLLDPEGKIRFSGRLISENAEDFFHPIEEWISEYFVDPAEITSIEICLEYINSTGTKYLLDIIHKITLVHLGKNSEKFIVNWYYNDDDEDILDKGKIFSSSLDVPFNFIRII